MERKPRLRIFFPAHAMPKYRLFGRVAASVAGRWSTLTSARGEEVAGITGRSLASALTSLASAFAAVIGDPIVSLLSAVTACRRSSLSLFDDLLARCPAYAIGRFVRSMSWGDDRRCSCYRFLALIIGYRAARSTLSSSYAVRLVARLRPSS